MRGGFCVRVSLRLHETKVSLLVYPVFSFCTSFVWLKRRLNRDKHPTLGTWPPRNISDIHLVYLEA